MIRVCVYKMYPQFQNNADMCDLEKWGQVGHIYDKFSIRAPRWTSASYYVSPVVVYTVGK